MNLEFKEGKEAVTVIREKKEGVISISRLSEKGFNIQIGEGCYLELDTSAFLD